METTPMIHTRHNGANRLSLFETKDTPCDECGIETNPENLYIFHKTVKIKHDGATETRVLHIAVHQECAEKLDDSWNPCGCGG